MQHDHVRKKLNFDLLTSRVRGTVCGQTICSHVATFRESNKFDMQHDHILKKMNFDLLTLSPRVMGEGGLRAKCLLPSAAFRDSRYFDMQHDHQHEHVLKKFNFDLWSLSQGRGM